MRRNTPRALVVAALALTLAAPPARANGGLAAKIASKILFSAIGLGALISLNDTPEGATLQQFKDSLKGKLNDYYIQGIQEDFGALVDKVARYDGSDGNTTRLEDLRTILRRSVLLEKRLKANIRDHDNPGNFWELMPAYTVVVAFRTRFWLEKDRVETTENTKVRAAGVALEALRDMGIFFVHDFTGPKGRLDCINLNPGEKLYSRSGRAVPDYLNHDGHAACPGDPGAWAKYTRGNALGGVGIGFGGAMGMAMPTKDQGPSDYEVAQAHAQARVEAAAKAGDLGAKMTLYGPYGGGGIRKVPPTGDDYLQTVYPDPDYFAKYPEPFFHPGTKRWTFVHPEPDGSYRVHDAPDQTAARYERMRLRLQGFPDQLGDLKEAAEHLVDIVFQHGDDKQIGELAAVAEVLLPGIPKRIQNWRGAKELAWQKAHPAEYAKQQEEARQKMARAFGGGSWGEAEAHYNAEQMARQRAAATHRFQSMLGLSGPQQGR